MPVSLPRFIKKAFAADGLKATIPDASDNATGRAGYNQGFPPINMQPKEAGGIPPRGEDMNGVIYDVTLAISYIQSGKSFPFNSDFAVAIGGYPVGAIVSDSANSSEAWLNLSENNVSFPTGWDKFSFDVPSETQRGIPRFATSPEVQNFLNIPVAVSPFGIKAAFSGQNLVTSGNSIVEKMPGGLIRQYGYANNSPGTVIFPLAFPDGVRNITFSVVNTLNEDATAVITGTSRTSFTWIGKINGVPSTGTNVGIFWCATGM